MKKWIVAILLAPILCRAAETGSAISLNGQWRFELDRADAGVQEHWFDHALPEKIHLPGSLPAQGIGDDITTNTPWVGGVSGSPWFTAPEYAKYRQPGNVKVPFWLQPEKYYKGVAWFQREIEVPKNWAGMRVVLSLERPHWETSVWVDGRFIGTNISLSTPHEYDCGQLAPGKHTLSIRVDNRMIIDIGENSHAMSDHTQGDWNGIVGKIELRATSLVWIEDAQVYPNVEEKSALLKIRFGNATGKPGKGMLEVATKLEGSHHARSDDPQPIRAPVAWDADGGSAEVRIPLGDHAQLWDEFHPALYDLTATLSEEDGAKNTRDISFGLREISTQGTQFVLNGRKIFIRGTLECCIFPKTGHPPTDVASWKRIIRIAKSYGLNLIRFHSYCPPEAAFIAGDELGFYFQVETCWANQSTTIGDGKPVDEWVYHETDSILKHYGNHPSFLLMPYGNEPGGQEAKRGANGSYDYHAAFNDYFGKYVAHYKALDPRRLWTSASGWPQIPENQFDVTPDPRIQAWGEGLKSRINAKPPETTTDYRDYIQARSVPVISHEIGQWCVYPNFAEMPKYTGYLKPKNFEIFRESLEEHHMAGEARQFLLASGKLQTLCYKEDIESALRTPGMGGFELLDLHDFPGQGTALIGVLDPFWDDKGYVTAKQYSRFCNNTVPLARLPKRVFTSDETLEADLEVAHFGPAPMNAATKWKLVGADGKIIASGDFPAKTIPVDNGIPLGHIAVPLHSAATPQQCKLIVSLEENASADDTSKPQTYKNDWDIWVYPPKVNTQVPEDITVVDDLNATALAKLNAGGKVLLLIPPSRVRNTETDPVALGFSSIFWNTAWTGRQPPTTLGILCDPKNPALAGFPTEFHSNWQWWYIIHRAGAMILDDLPADLHPTVQVIDDWVTNHRLALAFEARVGSGKLMVCSIDLKNEWDNDPVRRQFRSSLLNYMESKQFQPRVELQADQIRGLIDSTPALEKLEGVQSIKADTAEAGYEASNAIDGDVNTLWHTAWSPEAKKYPHQLELEFTSPREFHGIAVLPRQEGRNGWIKDYAIYVSADGTEWGGAIARGTFSWDAKLKTVQFGRTITARAIRFVALDGFGSDSYASMAEFSILEH